MPTILITGANRGLGLELTKQFLNHHWEVIACCRKPDSAAELQSLAANYPLNIKQLDVNQPHTFTQFAADLSIPSIDILMNNAGVIGDNTAELGSIDAKALESLYLTNTIAPLLLSQALQHKVAKSDKKIIANMSSILGSIDLNNDAAYFGYRSSKAALNSITKSLSNALKPQHITVVSLHPGWVQTDMGGQNAPVTPEQSISGMYQVLDNLTFADTGSFIDYKGEALAW